MKWHRLHNQTVRVVRADFDTVEDMLYWCADEQVPFKRVLTADDEAGLGFVLPGTGLLDIVRAGDYVCVLPNGTYCSLSPEMYKQNCVPIEYEKGPVDMWNIVFKKVGGKYVLQSHTIPSLTDIYNTYGESVATRYREEQFCTGAQNSEEVVFLDSDGTRRYLSKKVSHTMEQVSSIVETLKECRRNLKRLVSDSEDGAVHEYTI